MVLIPASRPKRRWMLRAGRYVPSMFVEEEAAALARQERARLEEMGDRILTFPPRKRQRRVVRTGSGNQYAMTHEIDSYGPHPGESLTVTVMVSAIGATGIRDQVVERFELASSPAAERWRKASERLSRASLFAVAGAVFLLLGLVISAYDGYSEDGCNPMTTWPFGGSAFVLAGVAAVLTIRSGRPNLSRGQWAGAATAIVVALCAVAWISIGAWANSPC